MPFLLGGRNSPLKPGQFSLNPTLRFFTPTARTFFFFDVSLMNSSTFREWAFQHLPLSYFYLWVCLFSSKMSRNECVLLRCIENRLGNALSRRGETCFLWRSKQTKPNNRETSVSSTVDYVGIYCSPNFTTPICLTTPSTTPHNSHLLGNWLRGQEQKTSTG